MAKLMEDESSGRARTGTDIEEAQRFADRPRDAENFRSGFWISPLFSMSPSTA